MPEGKKNADVHLLYTSEHYKIIDFRCKCSGHSISEPEYQEKFAISYIRKGNFIYNVFRNSLDAFNGYFIVDKPGYEYTVKHFHIIPDESTTFHFDNYYYSMLKNEFKDRKSDFFNNKDIQSVLVKTNYETEYIHYAILRNTRSNSQRLLIDYLVMELVYEIFKSIFHDDQNIIIPDKLKRNHLLTIERAKEYIANNIENDISLNDIAENCYVSPFHFSRIFKSFTSYSPHQYLLNTRLKNAETLIKTTDLPITEICFSSGFNNLEHFSMAFKKKYFHSPQSFRFNRKNSKIS